MTIQTSKFTTTIDGTGSNGNIFFIVGTARRLMRHIGVKERDIDDMTLRVTASDSYDDALAIVREWFPVITDDDDEDSA